MAKNITISADAFARLKSKARNHVQKNDYKGSLTAAAGGAVGQVAFAAFGKAIPMLGSAAYGEGVALALAGHFVRRKNPQLGAGLLGAAGYALARQYAGSFLLAGTASNAQGYGYGYDAAAYDRAWREAEAAAYAGEDAAMLRGYDINKLLASGQSRAHTFARSSVASL